MKKTILEVYALAVCFFTVACLAITAGVAIYDVIQITAPQFTIDNYTYEKHQSNETFRKTLESCGDKDNKPVLSETELTKKREESWALEMRGEKHNGVQSLIFTLIIIFVSAIIFIIHWRIARLARESSIS